LYTGESPVIIGKMQDEARVWVQGFRPLPITHSSPELHELRPTKCYCSANRKSLFLVVCLYRWLSGDLGFLPVFRSCETDPGAYDFDVAT
ncbi:hypothetical protein HAX54_034577, partial [Datura stramonium]|nr:hypothetical protein [Datura stramonium]